MSLTCRLLIFLLLVLAGKVLRSDLEDAGYLFKGPGFANWGLGFRIQSWGLGIRVESLVFQVSGFGCRVEGVEIQG